MAKGKKKKGGKEGKSKKSKGSKGSSSNAVKPDDVPEEGAPISETACNKCHTNEGTSNDTCQHRFCEDCYESLQRDGLFQCFLCSEDEDDPNKTSSLAIRYAQAPPETKVLENFVTLNKGIKKLLSFTHQSLDSVERVMVDRHETFICVNPVEHKIHLFNRMGKYLKGVKYLFNHGFTGGVSLTHDEHFLVTLQGSKSTSVCFYTPDGKFRTSSFFQKGCHSHSIAVGTHNAIFALDAENRSLHFFNKNKKMCQSWTLQSVLSHGVDLWDCTLHITKDDKLLLFDAVKCQLFEVSGDDEIELKVSFAEQASLPEMSDDGSTSSMSHSQSQWTTKKLRYDSDEESEQDDDKKPPKPEEVMPLRPTSAGMKLGFISEVNENGEGKALPGQLPPIATAATKSGKKGKKAKGGKKGKKGNPNKNNNANGHVEFADEQEETKERTKGTESDQDEVKGMAESDTEDKLSIIDLSDGEFSKQSEPVSQSDIPVTCSTPIQMPMTVNLVDKFNPRNHPPLMVVDFHDCLILAYQGKISLFSPDGQFIKKILELNEPDEDTKFKVTIKYIVPFGVNRLAVLWHKHRARFMSKFFEVYSYNVPRKYRRSKSAYGKRKFTYDYDNEFDEWTSNDQKSACCVVQ